jgi:microcystin-dependent protein
MSQPYVGEIRMVGFNFAPSGWAFCDGSLLAISQFDVLFNLIGTTYGGDGQNTFALPNLQGRIPFHQGTSASGDTLVIGQLSGTETVTLTPNQLPSHTHTLGGNSSAGTQPSPAGGFWAQSSLKAYSTAAPAHAMASSAVSSVGGNQPHDNMPPFLAINFVISLFGIYPSQG